MDFAIFLNKGNRSFRKVYKEIIHYPERTDIMNESYRDYNFPGRFGYRRLVLHQIRYALYNHSYSKDRSKKNIFPNHQNKTQIRTCLNFDIFYYTHL
jgi:hypothetical protein